MLVETEKKLAGETSYYAGSEAELAQMHCDFRREIEEWGLEQTKGRRNDTRVTKVTEKCGAKFIDHGDETYFCELPWGHYKHVSQKHRFEGISWTQAGADRVARELAEAKEKSKSKQ